MKNTFEILKNLPPYGEMYVSFPENGFKQFSEGFVVKFYKKNGETWVGNFENGNSNLKFAKNLHHSDNILIIAFGTCYIINPEKKELVNSFGYYFNEIFEYKELFVLIDDNSITIIKNTDCIKVFNNLCIDYISDVKIEQKLLKGILNDYNSKGDNVQKKFNINLETLEINILKNHVTYPNLNANFKKKWWKFLVNFLKKKTL